MNKVTSAWAHHLVQDAHPSLGHCTSAIYSWSHPMVQETWPLVWWSRNPAPMPLDAGTWHRVKVTLVQCP